MASRLLIVEDEDTLCESLKRVFAKEGYEVDIALSAEEALSLLEEKTYHLIITDIVLPGISGIELLERCRTRDPAQKIIVMTAYASLETSVEALKAGACDFVVKPLMHEEIIGAVRRALGSGG